MRLSNTRRSEPTYLHPRKKENQVTRAKVLMENLLEWRWKKEVLLTLDIWNLACSTTTRCCNGNLQSDVNWISPLSLQGVVVILSRCISFDLSWTSSRHGLFGSPPCDLHPSELFSASYSIKLRHAKLLMTSSTSFYYDSHIMSRAVYFAIWAFSSLLYEPRNLWD